jgi:hypothetical protein
VQRRKIRGEDRGVGIKAMIEIEIRQSNIPYVVKGRLHVRVLPYRQIGYIRR